MLATLALLTTLAAEISIAGFLGPGQELDPERGLLVHEGTTEDGGRLVYERPVVVLPPVMTVGETHTSLRRFVLRRGGERAGVGSHYFEAELVGVETLEGHGECLKIRRHMLRMDFAGTQQGENVTEWYAASKGVVKRTGERFWKDAAGETTRTETLPGER